jgi:hypothetical protein
MKLLRISMAGVSVALVAVFLSVPVPAAETGLPVPDTSPDITDVSGDGRPLRVVEIAADTAPALKIAVQACAGLCNRKSGGSVYTRMNDKDTRWLEELALEPVTIMTADEFLDACIAEFPRCVRYAYKEQQTLLPNILTVSAVLDAIPIADEMDIGCGEVVFDAREAFRDLDTPYLATKYVYENHVNATTGLAMLNPGYSTSEGRVWNPALIGDMNPAMIDFVFSEKLFVTFLVNGCIRCSWQHALMNEIARNNPWPEPIGVYGYANYWMVFGGYLFEAQTLCAGSRNMGAIPTTVNNLSFFSTRRAPITEPGVMKQNAPEDVAYDPAMTYAAFIVGDGDNIRFMLDTRAKWFRQRLAAIRADSDSCPPLTWTISPHLARLAPDVLAWYYQMSRKTGKDYFMLPPSGHLYAYPSSLKAGSIQDRFVAATQADARLLGTNSTVHWEFFHRWWYAENLYLPKYAARDGAIRGVFPVNVPYLLPTGTWNYNQFFKVISGRDGGKTVLFRPREWRGISDEGIFLKKKFYLSPENMARELGAYPRGTVTGIYMTSDGGLDLNNSVMKLVRLLPDHVRLVSARTAVRLALEAAAAMTDG